MINNDTPRSANLSRRRIMAIAALGSAAGVGMTFARTAAQDGDGTPSSVAGDETAFLFVQSGFDSGILDQATEGVQSWMLTL